MRVLAAVLLISVGLPAAAQSRGQVEGRVTASASGQAIPGATVWLVAQSRGTAADGDGRFTLADLPEGRLVLTVSAEPVGRLAALQELDLSGCGPAGDR